MGDRDEHLARVADRQPAGPPRRPADSRPASRTRAALRHRSARSSPRAVSATAASSTFSATPSRARRKHPAHRRIARCDGGGTDGLDSRVGSSPGVNGTLCNFRPANFHPHVPTIRDPTRAMSDNSSLRPCDQRVPALRGRVDAAQHPEGRQHTQREQQQWAVLSTPAPGEDDVVARTGPAPSPKRSATRSTTAVRPAAFEVVHRPAAHTSAALTRPLTSALTGNGIEPM